MKIFVSLQDDRANAPSEMKRSGIELEHVGVRRSKIELEHVRVKNSNETNYLK